MRTDNIDRHKTIRSMVRGFFEGLFSALIEKVDNGNGESRRTARHRQDNTIQQT